MGRGVHEVYAFFTLVLVGLAAHAGGCTEVPDLSSDSLCAQAMSDDGNPCTKDRCDNTSVVHEVVSDGTACVVRSNTGTCQAGVCNLTCDDAETNTCNCGSAADCPASDECNDWACDAGTCARTIKAELELPDPTPGDCQIRKCGADGVAANVVGDDPKPSELCKDFSCQDGVNKEVPKPVGEACSDDQGPGVCDEALQCVECIIGDGHLGCPSGEVCYAPTGELPRCSTCMDGMLNGDELGVDCGGPCSMKCPNGTECTPERASECQLGNCVDGVCCASSCALQCNECNAQGMCVAIAKGLDDPNDSCGPDEACGGPGASCLKKAGASCTTNNECLSGVCMNNQCM